MNRHVVFVHGLRRPGEPVWMSSTEPPERWPLWLREEIEGLGVWSLEHASAPTRWRGHAMPRVDRASNALAAIMRKPRLKNGEIAFVAHSFGGLIVQELLRTADGRSATDADIAAFLTRVRRVAFLGTPHRGATLPVVSNALRIFGMQSAATEGMRRNDPDLPGLIQWFRKYAPANGISTLSLTESRRSGFLGLYGQVVKPDNADAGLPSDPILVDEDHFGIASPKSRGSDVYGEVLQFLTKPAIAAHSRTLVDAALDGISKVADTTAALERMQVSMAGQHFRAAVASSIADKECERRLDSLIKMRFLSGSEHAEESARLAKALIEGELASVSSNMKARALAWCGRLMVSKPNRTEGLAAIEAAKTFGRTDELVIAEAFAQFYETKSLDGLSRLAAIDSKLARSASFIIVGNSRNAKDALAWLQQSGLAFSDFDGDGKFFILVKQFEADDWSGALANVNTLSESDFLETPALIRAAAQTHLAQALPKDLIPFVFSSRASEVAPTPLRDDAQSLEHRRTARELFLRSSTVAEQLGCEPESSEASDWGLILGLRDPATKTEPQGVGAEHAGCEACAS